MMIYDYPPYLGPPLTKKEKEECEEVWQKLREEGRGIEPPTLAAPAFKTGYQPSSGTFQEGPKALRTEL